MDFPTAELYTSVRGRFERVYEALNQPDSLRMTVITDELPSKPFKSAIWINGLAKETARLGNRHDKILHYKGMAADGLSLYVDGNVRPIRNLVPMFKAFEQSRADIGMYRHYARSSVASEAQACLARNKVDNPETLAEELAHYAREGFPDTEGMWEGSVIFRRHSSTRLGAAMDEWWELYSRFQTRDQFSLPFVIWKHQLEVYDLDNHRPGREHYFVRLQHSDAGFRNKLARYLQARAPENAFWSSLQRGARILA